MAFAIAQRQLLNRLILGLLGVVLILDAVGVLVYGLRHEAFGAISDVLTVTVAVALFAAGLRHVYQAMVGRLPRWYLDFLLFAGVSVGGPDRRYGERSNRRMQLRRRGTLDKEVD